MVLPIAVWPVNKRPGPGRGVCRNISIEADVASFVGLQEIIG